MMPCSLLFVLAGRIAPAPIMAVFSTRLFCLRAIYLLAPFFLLAPTHFLFNTNLDCQIGCIT